MGNERFELLDKTYTSLSEVKKKLKRDFYEINYKIWDQI
jgi:hypothetical protein